MFWQRIIETCFQGSYQEIFPEVFNEKRSIYKNTCMVVKKDSVEGCLECFWHMQLLCLLTPPHLASFSKARKRRSNKININIVIT